MHGVRKIIPFSFLMSFFGIYGNFVTEAPLIWPVSIFLYSTGMVLLFLFIKNYKITLPLFIITVLAFFALEFGYFISYYLQNDGFNQAFLYHLRKDIIYAGVKEHIYILTIFLVLLSFLTYYACIISRINIVSSFKVFINSVLLLIIGLTISPSGESFVEQIIYSNNDIKGSKLYSLFPELYEELDKQKESFTLDKKPNIVLIYLEGIEQRYFDQIIFPDLVPELTNIKKDSIQFTEVSQGLGADWTIGGIVASQCGYPLVGSHNVTGNKLSVFEKFLPNTTCVGDILKRSGYKSIFVGGADSRFAGKDNFLKSHGYSEIFDRNDLLKTLDDKDYHNDWGAYDDTLFEFATSKFDDLSRKKSPFNLTILTLDSHHPDGFLSKSCENYEQIENTILDSVHCSDYLVTKFYNHIRKSPFSDNTYVFIVSDHLAMRNRASSLLNNSKNDENLLFVANIPGKKSKNIISPGLHYDIGPTILNLIGYDKNLQLGFGKSLIEGPGYLIEKFGETGWKKYHEEIFEVGKNRWKNNISIKERDIRFSLKNLRLYLGNDKLNLYRESTDRFPSSIVLLFNPETLELEKIEFFSHDHNLKRDTIYNILRDNVDKLSLVISRAKFLPGIIPPEIGMNNFIYYCGKFGSNLSSRGIIARDFIIPSEIIEKLAKSQTSKSVIISKRELYETVMD